MENPSKITEGGVVYTLGDFDGNCIRYDFNQILVYLEAKGKLLFGLNFRIRKSDRPVLRKLCAYTIGDPHSCKMYQLDLAKGILLCGPMGSSKSKFMQLVRHIVPHKKSYEMIPSRNVVFSFNHLGYKTIEDYGNSGYYCFYDLGVEPPGRHYGVNCNVLGEVLLSRYELYIASKGRLKTHATTDLNTRELEGFYGNRVRSRMRELFNLIVVEERQGNQEK